MSEAQEENPWKDRYLLEALVELKAGQKELQHSVKGVNDQVNAINGRLIAVEVRGGILSAFFGAATAWLTTHLKGSA